MNQVALCVVVALLTMTGLLTLGCLSTYWLRNHLDAATRLQRTSLIGVFAVMVLYAVIASVPKARYPFLSFLQPSEKESLQTMPPPVAIPRPIVAPLPAQQVSLPAVSDATLVSNLPEKPSLVTIPNEWWIGGLWLAGSAVSFSYLAYGHLCLVRLRRRSRIIADPVIYAEVAQLAEEGQITSPEVRLHPDDQGPLLAGIRRPTLYVPTTLPEDKTLRIMLLRHEMAHLARHDVVFLLCSRLLCALLWWHPLAYRLAGQMEQTAEEACDARAVQGEGGSNTPEYTRFLLKHLSSTRPITPAAVTAGIATPRSQVGKRITRLLAGGAIDKPATIRTRIIMVTSALLLVAVGGAVQSSLSAPPRVPKAMAATEDNGYRPTPEEFQRAFATSANTTKSTRSRRFQVMEFSDFECPSCRRANQPAPWRLTYPQMQTQFRHLPLAEIHPNATHAANLAQEYAINGSFWRAHDLLFAGRDLREQITILQRENEKVTFVDAVRYANKVRQEMYTKYQGKMTARLNYTTARAQAERMKPYLEQINVDKALANRWKVDSTPTYFVLNRQDNSVRRFVGYTAWKTYLQSVDSSALQKPYKMNLGNALRIKTANSPLTHILDMLFARTDMQYQVEPGLDLTNVKINATIQGDNFFDTLDKLQQASPVPFIIRQTDGDSKVVTLAPLPPHGTVTGRLTYPDGRPVAGYAIYADRWDQDLFLPRTQPNQGAAVNPDAEVLYGERTLTDNAGRFTLCRLGNFRYNVSVSLPDVNHKPVSQNWVAPAIEGVRPQINKTKDIGTIRLTRGGIVRGRVTDPSGKPLAKFYVGSHGPHRPETSGSVSPTETDGRGYYELRLPPGQSYVYVGMQHYRQEPTHFTLAEGETIIVNLVARPEAAQTTLPKFNREEENAPVSVTQYTSGNLTGRIVFDAAGSQAASKPKLEYLEVMARVAEEDRWTATDDPKEPLKSNPEAEILNGATSAVAPDGTFTLKNLGPFRYRIFVHQRTFYNAYNEPKMVQKWVTPVHQTERLAVGETGDIGTIPMAPGAVVRGRVRDNTGKPRTGVEIRGDQGSPFGCLDTRTDAKGSYTLYLPPGRSRVYVASLALKATSTRVTLAKGEHKNLDFQVEPVR